MNSTNSNASFSNFLFLSANLYSWNSLVLLCSLIVLLITTCVSTFFRGLRAVDYIPGIRCAFEPFSLPGLVIGTKSWNPGVNFQWARRLVLYKRYGAETVSIVPFIWGKATLWTSNLDVARQVTAAGPQSTWIKPEHFSAALLFFGMNLAAAPGGDIWRKHRRIMGPAFNNKTYQLVWNETMRVYHDIVTSEGWTHKVTIDIPVVQKHTFKLALFIISACGFGIPFSWNEPPVGQDGAISLQEMLRIISDTNLLRVAVPKWAYWLPIKKLQYIDTAHRKLTEFMLAQVAERRAEIRQELAMGESTDSERSDVFSRLILANECDEEKSPLDNGELIGNVFVLLFAGHETTGHTLAATLGYLGVYQEEQDIVYENIINVVGNDRDPTYNDYPDLYKVLAAFYESLRLIPAGSVLIRATSEDTILSLPGASADEMPQKHALAKGATVMVDMVGIRECDHCLEYNSRYFPDPNAYKPSRWYAQETSAQPDAFTAFGLGSRACVGRKFATTEAVCFLTLLLRDWRVEIVLENGESREQWRERILSAELILTLSVGNVPIRLVRRTQT